MHLSEANKACCLLHPLVLQSLPIVHPAPTFSAAGSFEGFFWSHCGWLMHSKVRGIRPPACRCWCLGPGHASHHSPLHLLALSNWLGLGADYRPQVLDARAGDNWIVPDLTNQLFYR